MRWKHLPYLVLMAATFGLPAIAAVDTVYHAADTALLARVLDDMEIQYEIVLDEDDDPAWIFTRSGILVTIASYDETSPGRYGSLLFYAAWAVDTPVSLAAVNGWNSRSRFGRAYVDDEGDPAIELDLLLTGGVTAETLKEYIEAFVAAVSNLGVELRL
jgi:hypothetical protein